MPHPVILLLTLAILWFASGCDCAPGDTQSGFGPDCKDATTTTDTSGSGTLLVSDLANSSIRKFTSVSTLNSASQSTAPLTGGLTKLTRPNYLYIHPSTGELVVPDEGTNAILFFESPTELTGNVAPKRVLTGVATELSGPAQVYVDSSTDELYVLNKGNSNILVFSNSSTVDGAVAPTRRIGGGNSGIANPNSFIFRSSADQLVVIDPDTLLTFDSVRTANGDPSPVGRVTGTATTFSNLVYGELTDNGTLILADAGTDQIISFDGWQFDQTNVAPTRKINGNNTSISDPRQFARVGDTLYLCDTGNILVFEDISTLQGDNFPTRKFSGVSPNTQTLQGLVFP